MGIHHHSMVPIEAAQAARRIGIDTHFIKYIGADHDLARCTAQHVYIFIKVDLHFIVLRPILDGVFHRDAVADISKGTVEFFFLFRSQNVTVDLDIHLALLLVVVEKGNVVHKSLIIHFMSRKIRVLLRIDTFHRDIDAVNACVNDLQTPFLRQQGRIGGGVKDETYHPSSSSNNRR